MRKGARTTGRGASGWADLRRRWARQLLGLVALVAVLVFLGPSPSTASGEAIVRSSGPRTQPLIALTFDDGTSPQNCRRILSELVARGVPATFFPIATAMSLDPAFWRLVGEAGYPVGDHTVTHPHMPMLTLAQQEWQIGQDRVIAEAILGRSLLRVFRPPYGVYDTATLVAAGATGFPIALLWDVDTRDWARNHTLAQMLAAGEQGRDGSVILMHCGPNVTPYLVPQIIDYYRSRGFRFVTIPQLLGVPWRPGPTESIAPATILNGLSPLAPLPSAAASAGPNASEPSPYTTPSPTSAASQAPGPSGTLSSAPGPSMSEAPGGASPPEASSTAAPMAAAAGSDGAEPLATALLVAALVGGALGVLSAARWRRRPGELGHPPPAR